MNVQSIRVDTIDPPLFNSRLEETTGSVEELKALGQSLKERQLEPIRVVPSGSNRYRLIFGSRRVAAAKAVGLESLNADVGEAQSEATEILENGIENVLRKDLSTFEQARLCAKLRELKLTGKEVAAKLGISIQHVSNLALCYEKLPDEIKNKWRKGEPGTDMNFLRSILTTRNEEGKVIDSDKADILAAFNDRQHALEEITGEEEEGEDEEEEEEETEKDADGKVTPKKYTVYVERYKKLVKALRAAKAPTMAIDACRYLVGDIESIRGLSLGDSKKPTKKTTKEGN